MEQQVRECGLTAEAADAGARPTGTVPGGRLWVLHTRARHEKKVAENLARGAFEHFLPLVPRRRRYGRRSLQFLVPLFPGYVFLAGEEGAVEAARRTNCVANVLRVVDQARLRAELTQIARVLSAGQATSLYPGLREGRRCRVTAGPLAGTEGVVVRWRNRKRLFLAITFIGQSAVVEIDAAALEAAD